MKEKSCAYPASMSSFRDLRPTNHLTAKDLHVDSHGLTGQNEDDTCYTMRTLQN